jgi:hypothetical protein
MKSSNGSLAACAALKAQAVCSASRATSTVTGVRRRRH